MPEAKVLVQSRLHPERVLRSAAGHELQVPESSDGQKSMRRLQEMAAISSGTHPATRISPALPGADNVEVTSSAMEKPSRAKQQLPQSNDVDGEQKSLDLGSDSDSDLSIVTDASSPRSPRQHNKSPFEEGDEPLSKKNSRARARAKAKIMLTVNPPPRRGKVGQDEVGSQTFVSLPITTQRRQYHMGVPVPPGLVNPFKPPPKSHTSATQVPFSTDGKPGSNPSVGAAAAQGSNANEQVVQPTDLDDDLAQLRAAVQKFYGRKKLQPNGSADSSSSQGRNGNKRKLEHSKSESEKKLGHQPSREDEIKIAASDDHCSTCLLPGDLLCCDFCPRTFHSSCVEEGFLANELPEGVWECKICKANRVRILNVVRSLLINCVSFQKLPDFPADAYERAKTKPKPKKARVASNASSFQSSAQLFDSARKPRYIPTTVEGVRSSSSVVAVAFSEMLWHLAISPPKTFELTPDIKTLFDGVLSHPVSGAFIDMRETEVLGVTHSGRSSRSTHTRKNALDERALQPRPPMQPPLPENLPWGWKDSRGGRLSVTQSENNAGSGTTPSTATHSGTNNAGTTAQESVPMCYHCSKSGEKFATHCFLESFTHGTQSVGLAEDASGGVIKFGAPRLELIKCDFCDLSWHLDCLTPPLTALPPQIRQEKETVDINYARKLRSRTWGHETVTGDAWEYSDDGGGTQGVRLNLGIPMVGESTDEPVGTMSAYGPQPIPSTLTLRRKWMCPCHAELAVPKKRKLRDWIWVEVKEDVDPSDAEDMIQEEPGNSGEREQSAPQNGGASPFLFSNQENGMEVDSTPGDYRSQTYGREQDDHPQMPRAEAVQNLEEDEFLEIDANGRAVSPSTFSTLSTVSSITTISTSSASEGNPRNEIRNHLLMHHDRRFGHPHVARPPFFRPIPRPITPTLPLVHVFVPRPEGLMYQGVAPVWHPPQPGYPMNRPPMPLPIIPSNAVIQTRNSRNDGDVEVVNDIPAAEFESAGVRYRIPERRIKLDFLQKVRTMRELQDQLDAERDSSSSSSSPNSGRSVNDDAWDEGITDEQREALARTMESLPPGLDENWSCPIGELYESGNTEQDRNDGDSDAKRPRKKRRTARNSQNTSEITGDSANVLEGGEAKSQKKPNDGAETKPGAGGKRRANLPLKPLKPVRPSVRWSQRSGSIGSTTRRPPWMDALPVVASLVEMTRDSRDRVFRRWEASRATDAEVEEVKIYGFNFFNSMLMGHL
ncbi:hypothetical protein BJ742DRAFT_270956 [Cladochytrium replicatum]|nr:hypothetical protein BJ742DRAFT_270956 [Cladochytrium replicatum]